MAEPALEVFYTVEQGKAFIIGICPCKVPGFVFVLFVGCFFKTAFPLAVLELTL